MNSKIFRQYDGPWAKKPYPTKGCTVSGAGCGLVACTHIAIEQDRYKNWTPENLRPYMLKYAVAGQGTTWDGITKTLQYLGHKVKYITEATPMKDAFAELNKGNRIGIILFYGGYSKRYKKWYRTPDGTVWTGNGHYMMFGAYKYEDNKHWFYMKDSGGRKHDGWYSYEKSMKGCVGQMWIVERINPIKATTPTVKPSTTTDGKLVVDGVGGGATVKAMQRFLGTTQDGKISGQSKACAKYYPSLKAVEYGKGGSVCVRNLQRWLGITQDGIWGKGTSTALQKKIGVTADGIFGKGSMSAWQKYLNANDKAVYPTPTPAPSTSTIDKTIAWATKIANDNSWHYVVQNTSDSKTRKCPICQKYGTGKYHGWNCIRFVGAAYFHGGGVKIKSDGHTLCSTASANKLLKSSASDAVKQWTERNGGTWSIVSNGKKKIPQSMLKKGDVLVCYNKEGSSANYQHMALYIGDGYIIDSNSSNGISKRKYSSMGVKTLLAFRYTGK